MDKALNQTILDWPNLLALMEDREASDLHLATGRVPHLRVQGKLEPLQGCAPVNEERMEALAADLTRPREWDGLPESGSLDGAVSSQRGGRFRYNLFRRLPGIGIAVRRLEKEFRTLAELGVSEKIAKWVDFPDGLILVAGPTGSGKSTTLATLIDLINQHRTCHIVTIEDPIEYLHEGKRSLIDQRQVGLHTPDFQTALVASMRQDPDVILVGEIREQETIRTALTAAETGHLVFATVHAPDCTGALQRVLSVFPPDEQPGMARLMSLNLRGVLAQHLVPADGPQASREHDFRRGKRSRVLLTEILQVTPAVAHLVAKTHFSQLYSSMETGGAQEMQTLEENLFQWVQRGFLRKETALSYTKRTKVLGQRFMRGSHHG